MRTNIVLDDELVNKAFQYTNVHTKRELVHLALEEFVISHGRKDIRAIRGKVKIDPQYDYKSLRTR